jgi:hypothetical protein
VPEQAFIVALVQANRGLVEHVHHADQACADLRGEADALRLAAGERVGLALQREVIEADIDQEAQAVGDLLDDLDRDLAAPAGQVEALEELSASSIGSTTIWGSGFSATKTLRAARLRRAPWHSVQDRSLMYFASSSRTAADSVSL